MKTIGSRNYTLQYIKQCKAVALKNKQRERFCLEYASGQNGTQAAVAAGYSEKTAGSKANQLLKIVEVKNRIDELMAQIASEKVADAQEVMEYLTSV